MFSVPAITVLYIIWLLLLTATHISLTIVVYKDAQNLAYSPMDISPFLWAGISFSLPVIGMFVYWLMNHSTLSKVNYLKIQNLEKYKEKT